MGGSPEWGGWERNYKSKVFLWSTKTFHHMQPLGNMYNSKELAGGKGRVTAEKKQGQKSTCKDFRYQGGKKKKSLWKIKNVAVSERKQHPVPCWGTADWPKDCKPLPEPDKPSLGLHQETLQLPLAKLQETSGQGTYLIKARAAGGG